MVIVFVLIEIIEDHGASHIWCVSAHTLMSLLGVAILASFVSVLGLHFFMCAMDFSWVCRCTQKLCFVGGGTVIFCKVIQHATCADVMHMYTCRQSCELLVWFV